MQARRGKENYEEGRWLWDEAKPSCKSRQSGLENRSLTVSLLVNKSLEDGYFSVFEASRVLLGLRGIAKATKKAREAKCDVANGTDTAALEAIVKSTVRASPCYPRAKQVLDAAKDMSASEQEAARAKADAILFSPKCETVPDSSDQRPPDAGDEAIAQEEDEEEEETDDGAAELEDLSLKTAMNESLNVSDVVRRVVGNLTAEEKEMVANLLFGVLAITTWLLVVVSCGAVATIVRPAANVVLAIWNVIWCTLKAAIWQTIYFFTGYTPNWSSFQQCFAGKGGFKPWRPSACLSMGIS